MLIYMLMKNIILSLSLIIFYSVAITNSYAEQDSNTNSSDSLSLVFVSDKDFNTTINDLKHAIKAYNFRVYKNRYLLQDLEGKIDENQVVIRFCNFEHMAKFIKIEPRVGLLLPCKVTVIKDKNNQVKILVKNYKRLINDFNNQKLINETKDLLPQMQDMIEEALL